MTADAVLVACQRAGLDDDRLEAYFAGDGTEAEAEAVEREWNLIVAGDVRTAEPEDESWQSSDNPEPVL